MPSSGKYAVNGVRTSSISSRSMAIPTSAAITLFDADLTLAGRGADALL